MYDSVKRQNQVEPGDKLQIQERRLNRLEEATFGEYLYCSFFLCKIWMAVSIIFIANQLTKKDEKKYIIFIIYSFTCS